MNDVRCHHCGKWIGESSAPLRFVGMFEHPDARSSVTIPRETYRCDKCKWVNVFRRTAASVPSWRGEIELKQHAG